MREEVGSWLYRVARNLCMDHHRLRSRQVPSASIGDANVDRSAGGADEGDPVQHVVREEEREVVRAALTGLTDRHRDVLYLRDVEGLAYQELGARHGLSEPGARAVIARARRRLRDEIKTMGQGVFGIGAAVRLRIDDLFRRLGAERAPVEPIAAAVAHYVVAAAAVMGMALGSPTAPHLASRDLGAHDPIASVAGEGGAGSPGAPTGAIDDTGPASSAPDDPADPRVVVELGPAPGAGAGGVVLDPDGNGSIDGTLVSIHPEHAPFGMEAPARRAADVICAAEGACS